MAEDKQGRRQTAERQRRVTDRDIKTDGSYYLPCAVARLRALTPGEKILYAVLRKLARGNDFVGVSQPILAKMTGASQPSIRLWCRRLECQGLIQTVHDQACNWYYLLLVDKQCKRIPVDGRVLSRADLTQAEKLVLSYIAWRQGKDGWCRQNHREIAAGLGLSRGKISLTARRLKAVGEIEARKAPDRQRGQQWYRVT